MKSLILRPVVFFLILPSIAFSQPKFDDVILGKFKELRDKKQVIEQNFVKIKPGKFLMGSPENETGRNIDEKQHLIHIDYEFEMLSTEVTQFHYFERIGSTGGVAYKNEEDCLGGHAEFYHGDSLHGVCINSPMNRVTWVGAQEYINELNSNNNDGYLYRLPTEAEWEYAARAGSTTNYHCGDSIDCLFDYEVFNVDYSEGPRKIASKKPNAFGLYDMLGNVRELVEDQYIPNYEILPQSNPVNCASINYNNSSRTPSLICNEYRSPNEPRRLVTIKGGCFESSTDSSYLRSAARLPKVPYLSWYSMGFRLVRIKKN